MQQDIYWDYGARGSDTTPHLSSLSLWEAGENQMKIAVAQQVAAVTRYNNGKQNESKREKGWEMESTGVVFTWAGTGGGNQELSSLIK